VHHLQGKAERVTPAEYLQILRDFSHDKRALRQRHEAAARLIGDYDVNNTYQYIIAREDMHLAWLRAAVEQVASDTGQPPGDPAVAPAPPIEAGRRDAPDAIAATDRDQARAFVDRWRAPVEAMTHARHRGLLRVILGETLEHARFFEQAAAGRRDLLGRRADGAGTTGQVLSERWIE
jgi:hypothetical protein